jgi:DNA invertase Pin-like site-specific DNA recombinase
VAPRRKTAEPGTVVGYIRVSTEEQANSGLGLETQRAKLVTECDRQGWTLVDVLADEGISAKRMDNRPALQRALARVENGDAAILMVAKLDRLSRSVHDFTGVVARADRNGWSLVVLDLGVDTSTPTGDMMANVMASFAQFERKLIGQRTADALQVKKAQGARLGRPDRAAPETVARIVAMRRGGATLSAIATALTAEGVPTSQGGARWYPSTIAAVLRRADAAAPEETA